MQLKIQRSQRVGGIAATTVFFCLDVRSDYSSEERDNVQKYKLGGQIIYNSQAARRHLESASAHLNSSQSGSVASRAAGLAKGVAALALSKMQLNISIASLARGHHIECKDLEELLEAEDTVRGACKNLTRFLQVAETFNGSELVVDYVNGEEQIHITEHAPALLEYAPAGTSPQIANASVTPGEEFEEWVRAFWANPQYRKLTYAAGAAILFLLLMRSCMG